MEIIGVDKLNNFMLKHSNIKSQLKSWIAEVSDTIWETPIDIKIRYSSASFLSNNIVVFNIKGNNYRLVTKVNFKNRIVLIKNIGTHSEYSKWNLK